MNRFLKLFGYQIIKASDGNYLVENAELIVDRDKLRKRVAFLELEMKDYDRAKYPIPIDTGDPSPVDREKRKLYVAQVAALHKDILEPKLKHMIGNTFKQLEAMDNDRDFDLTMKGVIYAFREIIRWGDAMLNEQLANQIGDLTKTNNQNNED